MTDTEKTPVEMDALYAASGIKCQRADLGDVAFDGTGRGTRWICQICGSMYQHDFTPIRPLTTLERAEVDAAWLANGFTPEQLAALTLPPRPPCS